MSVVKIFRPVLNYLAAPLLFSIYPVIFLYTHNVEILVLDQLILPLLLAIGLAVVIFLFFLLILKDKTQASLAAVGFVILFWYYGMVFEGITKIVNLNHWHILPILLFVYVHLIYLIRVLHRRNSLKNINTIAISVAAVLILFNLVMLVPAEVKKHQIAAFNMRSQNENKEERHLNADYPDIYLIILDEYARFDTIKEEWGYDNSTFREFLKDNGFFVADKSVTKYASTEKMIPSFMDLNYVSDNLSTTELQHKIRNSWLFDYFDNRGYKIIYLNGGGSEKYKPVNKNVSHKFILDLDVQQDDVRLNEFTYLALKKSMLAPIDEFININNSNQYYLGNKFYFKYIAELPTQNNNKEQPTLLFAHILCPHLPFVFDRNGNFMKNPTNYWEYMSVEKDVLKKLYLEQYIYVTKEIMTIVHQVLKTSKDKPIIVLISDHGPRKVSAGIENIIQHRRVLNAIYFPDGDYTDLYDNISTINALRVLMNKYFDQNYEMLEDE